MRFAGNKAAIVLGGGIKIVSKIDEQPFYEPEKQVKDRLDFALELYLKQEVNFIITTGNYSKRVGIDLNIEDPKTEAEVGKKYLIEKHEEKLDQAQYNFSDKILFENKSFDTIGNAWFAKQECLMPNNIKECVVITSDYHLERSKLCFDWVLGADYNIKYIGIGSPLKNDTERVKVETVFNKFMRENLINSIPAGDDVQIGQFIKTEHLVYCMSQRSEAQFNACMETASIKKGY